MRADVKSVIYLLSFIPYFKEEEEAAVGKPQKLHHDNFMDLILFLHCQSFSVFPERHKHALGLNRRTGARLLLSLPYKTASKETCST